MISICIPVYNFEIDLLVKALSTQIEAVDAAVELIVIDDNSGADIKSRNKSSCQNCMYIELPENIGRSKIRNLFLNYASQDYLLFLDCDSLIENPRFLTNYLETLKDQPKVVCGGRIYGPRPPGRQQRLRWKYGVYKESKTCETRREQPYNSFMSNNFLIQRSVLQEIRFDERITQYGHEDTLFGYSLKSNQIPITHIDNPVLNGDIESNAEFLRKTREGVINLKAILNYEEYHQDLIQDISLLRFYYKIRKFENIVLWFFLLKRPLINCLLSKGYVSLPLFDFYKLGLFIEQK
ncbi:MAG: glycosyltransferase family 2 protein [Bacteroidales bacterium]|nr:glycosyltransferase family 2 protein [Bacteroidales bacterium]MDD3431117.1 glycosyltransferase family 2 protein [Bacteroidales bacterium]MDD4361774.1 glycosyltransferase family 2 protein [Bacteroidales bacterium]MDD4431173.1 glycosyltransferase family 2 protein [Bacteroidales bacterium]